MFLLSLHVCHVIYLSLYILCLIVCDDKRLLESVCPEFNAYSFPSLHPKQIEDVGISW